MSLFLMDREVHPELPFSLGDPGPIWHMVHIFINDEVRNCKLVHRLTTKSQPADGKPSLKGVWSEPHGPFYTGGPNHVSGATGVQSSDFVHMLII